MLGAAWHVMVHENGFSLGAAQVRCNGRISILDVVSSR